MAPQDRREDQEAYARAARRVVETWRAHRRIAERHAWRAASLDFLIELEALAHPELDGPTLRRVVERALSPEDRDRWLAESGHAT